MMNHQSLGSGSLSSGDLPLKRKRGRPRKDDSHVQGENSPVTPVPDSGKKNKQTAAATDPAVDLVVGQVVSGVIEGSFEAGYLLNVKVGGSDTNLKGVVFLPGRCTPITAANDVAPNVRMYKRMDIPIPFQNPQTHRRDFVPPSRQINKQATEVKIDGPKFPDRILPSELQSGIPTTGKNQSASVILPLGVELPRNETGLALGETVPLQKLSDSGKESQAAAFMAQLLHDKAVEKDEVQQATNMEIEEANESEPASAPFVVVVEKDEVQQGTNMEIEETNESEPASAPLVDMTPSSGYINQEPQVENQVSSSDVKPKELVHSEVKDLNSMEIEETQESEPASVPLVDITPSTGNINQEPQVEIQALSSDLKPNELVHNEVKDLKKNEDSKTALTAESESMLSEPVGIGMLMEKPKLEHSQNPLFAAPESRSSEAIGISMMMEKPNLEDDRSLLFAEPESMAPELIGINFLVDDKQNSLNKDTQHMPSEPVGISTLMEKPQLEQNQAPLFAAPESIPSEPIGISMLVEKPNVEGHPLFAEPESMSPESIVINFLANKQNSPKKDTHDMPSEPTGISILMEKPQLEHNQTPLFAAPESTPSKPVGIGMLIEKPNLEEDRTLLFAEPEAMSPKPIGINFLVDKQNSSMKDTQDMPSEPVGISTMMEKPKLEHNQLPMCAALDSLPSGSIGISMLMEKPNLEDGRTSLFAEPEPISREPIGINFLVDKQNSSKKDTQDMLSEQVGISTLMEKPKREHSETLLFAALESISSDPIGINMLMEKPNLEDDRTPLFAELKSMSPEPIGINFLFDKENSPEKDTQDMPSEPANRPLYGDDTSNITAGGSYSAPMTNLSVLLFEGEAVPSQPTSLGNEGSALPRMFDTQICSSSSGATNNVDSGIKDGITATHLELSSGLNLSGSGSLKNSRQEQN